MTTANAFAARPAGDRALLLELPDNAAVHAAARLARERYASQLAEVVPGHSTLLLAWRERATVPDVSALAPLFTAPETKRGGDAQAQAVVVGVRYDGVDLAAVATALGASSQEVVELHAAGTYVVAFMGFAPGFPYLITEPHDDRVARLLGLPRLATPRTTVPAGSVAVAAGYCGIYPRSSPGGWNLLGQSDLVLFDPAREPPSLLEPGVRVRFEPV